MVFGHKKVKEDMINNLYLEDSPTIEDRFGYNDIALSLQEALEQSNFPTHISLMGEWGSGKSTVVELLKEKLKSSEEYALESISVWKFSDNSTSLQRKIIREIQSTLKIEDNNGLDFQTENHESSTATGLPAYYYSLRLNKKSLTITSISSLAVVLALFTLFANTYISNWILSLFASLGVGSVLVISYLVTLFNSKIQVQLRHTSKYLPLDYGDQFEERFKRAVSQFLERERKKKLILVFDDMDRLPPNQLYSTLNTIKTFLHSKQCAFIVPCDEKVLRLELKEAFNQQSNNSDVSEFLNKTFDITIKLPQVEHTNMKIFAENLLRESEIKWFLEPLIQENYRNILGILLHPEIDTPRKVKKILNSFGSDWYIANERDKGNSSNVLTKYPDMLAIYTVFKTSYLEVFEIIQENLAIFKDSEDVDDLISLIESLMLYKEKNSKYEKEELENTSSTVIKDDIARKVPRLFIKRVYDRLKKHNDPRPYLYFSNQKLNAITTIKELTQLKDLVLNADVKGYREKFNLLKDEQKTSFLDFIIPEFYSDDEIINGIKCIFSYPESLAYVDIMRAEWEDLLSHHITTSINEIGLSNTIDVLEYLQGNDLTWSKLGECIKDEEKVLDLMNTWVEKPFIYTKLPFNISGLIQEHWSMLNNELGEYYVSSLLLDLPSDHTMTTSISWDRYLLEDVKSIVIRNKGIDKRNKEREENSENDEELEKKLPLQLPYKLIDWIEALETKTDTIISGEWLYKFLNAYRIYGNMDTLSGIGEYWGNKVKRTNDINEVKIFTDSLARKGNIQLLFNQDTWIILKEKIKKGYTTDEIERNITAFAERMLDKDEEVLKEFLLEMKDSNVLTSWALENYSFSESSIDIALETLFVENSSSINLEGFFERADEYVKSKEIEAIMALNRIIASSKIFYKFGETEGYFSNWSDLNSNDVLNYKHDDLQIFLEFVNLVSEDKYKYVNNNVSIMEYLLSYSNYWTSNNNTPPGLYRKNWTHHLSHLYSSIVKNSYFVEWEEVIETLQSVKLKSNPNHNVSIVSHVNNTEIETSIPIIAESTSLSSRIVNEFLINRINILNRNHLKVLVNRWKYLKQAEKEFLYDKIREEDMEKDFGGEFITSQIKNPQLDYLEDLKQEPFNDNEKEKVMETIIRNSKAEDLNNWLVHRFDNISETFEYWENRAAVFMITEKRVTPKIDVETIRDALSYGDVRTRIALMLIPLIFSNSKLETKKLKPYLRQKILNIENENDAMKDLAKESRLYFNWQNRERVKIR
ncbi:KAP family NTPase [Aquibacillus koreensis]|uniref:KAP family NTPase n=1 Tax=Aquibacillus koreensis TaxID=279446 RepID=A0A9X4AH47_9BACI|nr:KAP family NTPase [Aquibacillus koreensis]MCT2534783.1 KAP family NTPase [Aquibacillus koreensis]MDC3419606.1 KAP family NTPase [Aquibacillus koreensis]